MILNGVSYQMHGLSGHPLYSVYCGMMQRCYDPKSVGYQYYGARGISVCDRWRGPDGLVHFIKDMGLRPDGYTLERCNNDGPYSPDNCKWSTIAEQNANRRPFRSRANRIGRLMSEPYRSVSLRPSAYRKLLTYLGKLQEHRDSRVSYSDAIESLIDRAESSRNVQ